MIQIIPVQSRKEQKAFIRVPWKIYKGDPNWVSPLIIELKKFFSPKHPFYDYGEMQCFIAKKDEVIVGRIAAINNPLYEKYHHEKVGFFGFFECIEDQNVANALIDTAKKWIVRRGMTAIHGPFSPSINYEFGTLIEGFEDAPRIMMPYNPPYYNQLFLKYGLKKAKTLYAYKVDVAQAIENEKLTRVVKLIKQRYGVKIRQFNLKKLKTEIVNVKYLYNKAWEANWGHIPLTDKEMDAMAADLKPIAEAPLLLFAEIEGQVIGMGMALLDVNYILKQMNGRLFPFNFLKFFTQKKHIQWTRVLTLGVLPQYRRKGIDGVLCYELLKGALNMGIKYGEGSWVLEDNEMMNRSMRNVNGEIYKKYVVYKMSV